MAVLNDAVHIIKKLRRSVRDLFDILAEEREDLTPQKEYRRLELKLKGIYDRKNIVLIITGCIITGIIVGILSSICVLFTPAARESLFQIPTFVCAIATGIVVFACCMWICFSNLYVKEYGIRQRMIDIEADGLNGMDDTCIFESEYDSFYDKLVNDSYCHLDRYYEQTRIHAHRGFLVGCGVFIVGIIFLLYYGTQQSGSVMLGFSVIVDLIGLGFFYIYSQSVSSMGIYHKRLVLFQNLTVALRTASSMQEPERSKANMIIIEELMRDFNNHFAKEDDNTNKEQHFSSSRKT